MPRLPFRAAPSGNDRNAGASGTADAHVRYGHGRITDEGTSCLVPSGSRTPGHNRYRCFLSDLTGLAALPPSGSRSVSSVKTGGEGEIRTPGTGLGYTRFPIVLLRPSRTPLRARRQCLADAGAAWQAKSAGSAPILRPPFRRPHFIGIRKGWRRFSIPTPPARQHAVRNCRKHKRPTLASGPLRKSRNRGGTAGIVHTAGISFSGKEDEPLCEGSVLFPYVTGAKGEV